MPEHPLAYFITFRTYGTWLSGDPRGSVDRRHNEYGAPLLPRDDFRKNYQQRRMRGTEASIDPAMRRCIEEVIAELAAFRGWELFALNVRTNHVHVVVAASEPPERVMKDVKARSTLALRRAGLLRADQPIWATGGSTRRAWEAKRLEAYIRYTLLAQGNGLPGADWAEQEWGDSEL